MYVLILHVSEDVYERTWLVFILRETGELSRPLKENVSALVKGLLLNYFMPETVMNGFCSFEIHADSVSKIRKFYSRL